MTGALIENLHTERQDLSTNTHAGCWKAARASRSPTWTRRLAPDGIPACSPPRLLPGRPVRSYPQPRTRKEPDDQRHQYSPRGPARADDQQHQGRWSPALRAHRARVPGRSPAQVRARRVPGGRLRQQGDHHQARRRPARQLPLRSDRRGDDARPARPAARRKRAGDRGRHRLQRRTAGRTRRPDRQRHHHRHPPRRHRPRPPRPGRNRQRPGAGGHRRRRLRRPGPGPLRQDHRHGGAVGSAPRVVRTARPRGDARGPAALARPGPQRRVRPSRRPPACRQ